MKLFISSEGKMKYTNKNHGVHFISGDMVLCIDIFLHLEETLILHKIFLKII